MISRTIISLSNFADIVSPPQPVVNLETFSYSTVKRDINTNAIVFSDYRDSDEEGVWTIEAPLDVQFTENDDLYVFSWKTPNPRTSAFPTYYRLMAFVVDNPQHEVFIKQTPGSALMTSFNKNNLAIASGTNYIVRIYSVDSSNQIYPDVFGTTGDVHVAP